jgi:predicted TIM-barrel fold metal-dependent hydrolase
MTSCCQLAVRNGCEGLTTSLYEIDAKAMNKTITYTRRQAILTLAGGSTLVAARPAGLIIDTHIHLFADDTRTFPYHAKASYKPQPAPLEAYNRFIAQSRIDHAIIVHPEPYQDDHSYLEHCFRAEPSPGFFKGTCLYDPIDPKTPQRMKDLVSRNPKRIVALRVHINRKPGEAPTVAGTIRDRDLRHPQMKKTWAAAHQLGLAIKMHFIPHWAPQIGELAAQFPAMPIVLDHLARSGQGTPQEYEQVLQLAKHPKVVMKFSGVGYSSKEKPPYRDAQPLVRRTFDAFGPDRMIWGGLGQSMPQFEQAFEVFESMFAFAKEQDRAKIRGRNAAHLFGFATSAF